MAEITAEQLAPSDIYVHIKPDPNLAKQVIELSDALVQIETVISKISSSMKGVNFNKSFSSAQAAQYKEDANALKLAILEHKKLQAEITKINADIAQQNKIASDAAIQSENLKQAAIKSTTDAQIKANNVAKSNLDLSDKQIASLKKKEAAAAREAANVAKTNDLYQQSVARLKDLDSILSNLNTKKALGHQMSTQEISDIEKLGAEHKNLYQVLSTVEQGLGRHQRNVGNYDSAMRGFRFSVAQVSRELPNASLGMHTFFLAISNNLPIMKDNFDNLKRSIAETNKALIAQGKTAQQMPTIWSAVRSAIFSWETAMAVAITLMVAYGAEIWDAGKKMLGFNDSLEKQNELLKEQKKLLQDVIDARIAFNNSQASNITTEIQNAQKLLEARQEFLKKYGKEEAIAIFKRRSLENDASAEMQQSALDEIKVLEKTKILSDEKILEEKKRIAYEIAAINTDAINTELENSKNLEKEKQDEYNKTLAIKTNAENTLSNRKREALNAQKRLAIRGTQQDIGTLENAELVPEAKAALDIAIKNAREAEKLLKEQQNIGKSLITKKEDIQKQADIAQYELLKEEKRKKEQAPEDVPIRLKDYTRYYKDLDTRHTNNEKFFKTENDLIEQEFIRENDLIVENAKNQVDLQIMSSKTQGELNDINRKLNDENFANQWAELKLKKDEFEKNIHQERVQLEDELRQKLYLENIKNRDRKILALTTQQQVEQFNTQQELNQKNIEAQMQIELNTRTTNKTGTPEAYRAEMDNIRDKAENEKKAQTARVSTIMDVLKNKQIELTAQEEIKKISAELAEGKITQDEFDLRANKINTKRDEDVVKNSNGGVVTGVGNEIVVIEKTAQEKALIESNAREAEIKKYNEYYNQQLDRIKTFGDEMLDAAKTGYDARADLHQQFTQRIIDLDNRMIMQQQELAAKGRPNQLAAAEAQEKKQEEVLRQSKIRQARIDEAAQEIKVFWNLFTTYSKKDNYTAMQAATDAFAGVGIGKAMAMVLGGKFFEGTERVEDDLKGNKVHNGRDGYHIAVDGSERILTGWQNDMLGGMSNEELVNNALMMQNSSFTQPIYVDSSRQQIINDVLQKQLINEVKDLKKVIQNQPVNLGLKFNDAQLLTETIMKNGQKEIITHINKYLKK